MTDKTFLVANDTGTWKVSTASGTYYILDLDKGYGKRVPSQEANVLVADEDWFAVRSIDCMIGSDMKLICYGLSLNDWYTWRRSTPVSNIEAAPELAWTEGA